MMRISGVMPGDEDFLYAKTRDYPPDIGGE